MELNDEQKACVAAVDGTYLALAAAGSGKTSTLVQRYLSMLTSGIPSKDILNLTFTSAGAEAMVRKVGLLDAEKVFRTFHSFCIELLKKERDNLPFKLNETVIPVSLEDYKLLFDLVKRYPAIKNFRSLQERISTWKRTNVEPAEAKELAVGEDYFYALAYEDYEIECREQGWLDFDGCIVETVKLLETNEEIRNRYKRKFISVDEFQDTDIRQVKLLKLLFDGNIFAVGDTNQCIYEWRNARPQNVVDFHKSFPNVQTLFLGRNYRSTARLVSFFKAILPVDNGIASHMVTDNEEGEDPIFVKYADDQEEAYWVLAQINDPTKTAIIARTNRQLFLFQRICMMRNIKYQILGKKDFFELNEVKRLLTLAKEDNSQRPASIVLAETIEKHDLMKLYKHSITRDSNPIENLNDVVKLAANRGTIAEFTAYLRKRMHGRKSNKGLTLSTVHQIKGREAKNVFFIGCNQGVVPHQDGELQEEKRIFYVGCTRAEKFLQVSYTANPSQFILEFLDENSQKGAS